MPTRLLFALPLILLMAFSTGLAEDTTDVAKSPGADATLQIRIASVFVEDQARAETFYTNTLGFVKKSDVQVGKFRWLTVVSPGNPDGPELLLEPNDNPAARTFQKAIFDQGIPATVFFVEDIQETYDVLSKRGVTFTIEPTDAGSTIIAVFDDTCGNLIQLAQEKESSQ